MARIHDNQYLDLVRDVLKNGQKCSDRTGTGTINVFSRELRFDLRDGSIPLLTTKKMHLPSIIHELLWYLKGESTVKYLNDNGIRIWNEWAREDGSFGPIYPTQWRNVKKPIGIEYNANPRPEIQYKTIDQIANVIEGLKNNPTSRRHIVNSWNVADLEDMELPPCHYSFQFWVRKLGMDGRLSKCSEDMKLEAEEMLKGGTNRQWVYDALENNGIPKYELSLKLTMRSSDVFLGLPFNIAQYSMLLHMIAQITNMSVGEFVYSGTDVHIYKNHITQCQEQIKREPFTSPTLKLNTNIKCIDDFNFEDFEIINYTHYPAIKGQVSV